MAIDGPAVRATLEARIEDSQRIRKQMFEEAKVSVLLCRLSMYACGLSSNSSTQLYKYSATHRSLTVMQKALRIITHRILISHPK